MQVSSSPCLTEESLWFLGGFPEHCDGQQQPEGGEGQQVPVSSTGMAVGMTDIQPKNSSQKNLSKKYPLI